VRNGAGRNDDGRNESEVLLEPRQLRELTVRSVAHIVRGQLETKIEVMKGEVK
jgi:hypothetical protein